MAALKSGKNGAARKMKNININAAGLGVNCISGQIGRKRATAMGGMAGVAIDATASGGIEKIKRSEKSNGRRERRANGGGQQAWRHGKSGACAGMAGAKRLARGRANNVRAIVTSRCCRLPATFYRLYLLRLPLRLPGLDLRSPPLRLPYVALLFGLFRSFTTVLFCCLTAMRHLFCSVLGRRKRAGDE